MGDLLDEIAGVLDDSRFVSSNEKSFFNAHTAAAGYTSQYGIPMEERRQGPDWRDMDEFDRQLMRDTFPQPQDSQYNNVTSYPPVPASMESTFFTGPARLSLPMNTGNRSYYRPGNELGSIEKPQARRPNKMFDLSKFSYSPHTPEKTAKESSSPPPISSPTPYRRGHPYEGLVKQKHGSKATLYSETENRDFGAQPVQSSNREATFRKKAAPTPGAIALSHAPPIVQGIPLVSVNTLPDRFRGVFPYPLFNAVQSRCFSTVYESSDNLVLSSPTGSGKTVILELAICSLIKKLAEGSYKVIYQAPTKSLCAERKRDWEKKFSTLGLTCTELTGDTDQAQLRNVKNGDIIITTPEKWDSMTRRWQDHRKLLEMVRLFLIDEIHILKESRGATLEVVVSRMKSIGSDVRFVALSATVPNSADIAIWLGKDPQTPEKPAHEERFGEEFRPVKLQKFVYGYPATGNSFIFDKAMDKVLPDIIQKHSSGKPIMIFCMTRSMCVSTAKVLAEKWNSGGQRNRFWPAPTVRMSFRDKDLQTTGVCGVAFHHAGLDISDRALVERMFLEGKIHVICCTSTLAVGVNLPTHLVVIKNTVTWSDGGAKEYVDLEIMQMLGRAGRPQFDDTGVAVIMTTKEHKPRYDKMVSGSEILESCLHENLVEHMNAEIGLGTITDVESAKQWLKSTFLYVRLKKNPGHYKLEGQSLLKNIEQKLGDICEKDLNLLKVEDLLSDSDGRLKSTELGNAMARYYVKYGTMKTINRIPEKAKISEILLALSEAQEFRDLRFRGGEKGLYKELNKSASLKYSIKVDLATPAHKAFILMQFEVGMMEFPNEQNFQKYKTTLMQDKSLVFNHCHRVIRCIIDCKLHFRDSVAVRNALELARCLKAKVWENSPSQLRQIEGVGPVAIKKLVIAGIRSLDMLEKVEAYKIESIMSRNPPFGSNVLKAVKSIPRLRVFSHQVSKRGNRRDPVILTVRTEVGYLNDQVPGKFRGMTLYANFLAERSDGLLLEFRRLPIYKLDGGKDVKFTAELETPDQSIMCYLVCEDIVGTTAIHELKPDVDKSLFPPQTSIPSPLPPPKVSTDIAKVTGPPSGFRSASKLNESEDDYGDAEFLAAVEDLDFTHIDNFDTTITDQTRKNTTANSQIPSRRTSMNDDDDSKEPVQLPNGNWKCRHKCGDRAKCRHICCRDGLEKPPKPSKKKVASTSAATNSNEIRLVQPTGSFEKEVQRTKQNSTIERSFLPKPRVSALATCLRNAEIDVVDLAAEDDDPFFKSTAVTDLTKLKRLHSKSSTNTKNVNILSGKPKYSYSSGEQPDLSFFGTAKPSPSVEDDELPPLSTLLKYGKDSLPSTDTTDYEDAGLDSLMAGIEDPMPIGMVDVEFLKGNKTPGTVKPSNTGDTGMLPRRECWSGTKVDNRKRTLAARTPSPSPEDDNPLYRWAPGSSFDLTSSTIPNENGPILRPLDSSLLSPDMATGQKSPIFRSPARKKPRINGKAKGIPLLPRNFEREKPGLVSKSYNSDSFGENVLGFEDDEPPKYRFARQEKPTESERNQTEDMLQNQNFEPESRVESTAGFGGIFSKQPAEEEGGISDILGFLGDCVDYIE